tara:strand:+ start:2277 stop:2576 length:300 start_codon:yes stop_codon:yes gene_type:complete
MSAASTETSNPERLSEHGIQIDEHRWCCGACLGVILEQARDQALEVVVSQLHATVLKACKAAFTAAAVMHREEEMREALKDIFRELFQEHIFDPADLGQ